MAQAVRGTQSLVGQLSWVFARPSLTLIEVAWRWIFGIPMLLECRSFAQRILLALPPEAAGVTGINFQNPWVGAVQVGGVWAQYRPHVLAALPLISLPAAFAWAVISGVGRSILLKRMERRSALRPGSVVILQAAWLALFLAFWWGWFASIGWAATMHFAPNAEPDLVGFAIWAIFLSLGFFTLWALVSWVLTVAPLIAALDDCSVLSALGQALRLGKTLTGKLIEINLVMGIVKLMLIVLAMVFSSVLIPFSEEVGASALHVEWIVVAVFYFVANDYFQVVRVKQYIEFWRMYKSKAGPSATELSRA